MAQKPTEEEFHKFLDDMYHYTVPLIRVDQLKDADSFVILDTREKREYDVSHIPGAIWVGFSDFTLDRIKNIPKNQPVVVYCSVGYRSERIGEKLLEAGFDHVYNLYGSIFEWANRGYPLVDNSGEQVNQVHAYDKYWGRWVTGCKKVYR